MWRRRRPEEEPGRPGERPGRFVRRPGRRLPLPLRILMSLLGAVILFYLIVFITAWVK